MRWFKKLERELKKEYKETPKKSIYETALEKLKNNEEMWVECKDFPNYQVSNMGNVFFTKKGIPVLQRETSNGSKVVILRKDNKSSTRSVASLVAKSFEIPNKNNINVVYHIREVNNNRVDNLSYDVKKYGILFREDYFNKKEEEVKMKEKLVDEVILNVDEMEYSDKNRIDKELAKPKTSEANEVWKDVIGYERWYEVSSLGNIRKINDDGSRKLLKAKPSDEKRKGRTVGLRKVGNVKTYQVSHVVAEAFGLKPTGSNKTVVYHIDGDWNNDCLSNLTYDKKETDEYKKEQEKTMERKEQFLDYVNANKDFLKQAKEMNKEITTKDIYNKLCEILEVLKNDNR